MSHVTRCVIYPHPKSQKVIERAAELNNKNIYLLQIGAIVVTNWGSNYKLGQPLLQNRGVITNWGKIYKKLGQVLQIRAIITNWGTTHTSST